MLDLKEYGIVMWPEEKIVSFREKLLSWYDENKRDLPWRRSKNPYHIWVSEIMLQQTRVDTVIPYYERFLDWFPTVESLATAPEERLLKAWKVWVIILEFVICRLQLSRLWLTLVVNFQTPMKEFPA